MVFIWDHQVICIINGKDKRKTNSMVKKHCKQEPDANIESMTKKQIYITYNNFKIINKKQLT